MITELLKRVVARGVNLQTHTPVSKVSEVRDADGRWTVETPRGSIKAKYVVYATNAYTSALAPEYHGKIIPSRGVCSRIVVPNPPEKPLDASYLIRFNNWQYDYLIPRPDGSIIVGGARPAFFYDLKSWYGNTDDSNQVESATHYFDNYMQRIFHGYEDSGAYTDRVWTGSKSCSSLNVPAGADADISTVMGYTTDFLPHVGQIPQKPGQLVIAGFNGHGMPQIFLSAKGIAEMIVRGAEFEDTGLPRLFKTTQERLDSKENRILDAPYAAGQPRPRL